MRYVAFIGSRDLSQFSAEQLTLYKSTVLACVQHGYRIRTGAAAGADQLAAETALQQGGMVSLVLPWKDYEGEWVRRVYHGFKGKVCVTVYQDWTPRFEDWRCSVFQHHPAAKALKPGAIALHARNYGIVHESVAVVALPGYQRGGGGTAQGLRIATALGIKLYDLRSPQQCAELLARVDKQPKDHPDCYCDQIPEGGDPSHPALCRYCEEGL